ncbi:SGNH/GDSL hydrolase family protein [Methanosphaera sp. WGK6]|uniref:SGNH/GDSL hydrolase family protein n=1 Tax=Methanosphaera sp. WGK6 TaxID=1561964 RepID=UPI00084BD7AB|nr:SGNH/GDSL hydrolase family protein [Methanosphaera sp. WGK6]OED29828.1 hypothetical protein NL43_05930 [Methanosphaera sp. WGK6]
MEYLCSITDKLKQIDETDINYIDLLQHPEFFHGNIDFTGNTVNFCKFPKMTQDEMVEYEEGAVREMANLNSAPCGVRLRFYTDSKKIIFKIKLKRKWGYLKMLNWNALGFDIYQVIDDKYIHNTVFSPMDGHDTFAELVYVPNNGQLCIFLPNYDKIEQMYVGLEKASSIKPLPYPKENILPIIFYGNSVTQGAAASRSGNSFPNIISRKLNRDIINISCSSCCKGNDSIAELIGKINCHSIVLDYTRNASYTHIFRQTHEKFYKKIRELHPETKIILMTSESYNLWKDYDDFDKIVIETYENAIKRGENTVLLNQRSLFDINEYDYVTIDASHYTDYGMFKIADKICELLED